MSTRRVVALLAVVALLGVPAALAGGGLVQPGGARGCITQDGSEGCAPGRGMVAVAGVAISPDERHLYAAAANSKAVAVLARNARTGALTQLAGAAGCLSEPAADDCAAGRNLDTARIAAVSPDGRHVYVATLGGLAVFARSPRSGALRQLAGSRGCLNEDGASGCGVARAVTGGRNIGFGPGGRTLYLTSLDDAVAAFRRNPRSGVLTQLPGRRGCVKEAGLEREGCAVGRGLTNARAILVTRGGRRAYVASLGEPSTQIAGAVAVFRRDRDDGSLRQLAGRLGCVSSDSREGCLPVRGLIGPHDVKLALDGRTLYVPGTIAGAGGGLVILRRLSRDRLRQLPGSRGCFAHDGRDGCASLPSLVRAHTITFDPESRRAYVTSEMHTGWLGVFVPRGRRGGLRLARCFNVDAEFGCATVRALRGAHQAVLAEGGDWLYVAAVNGNGVVVMRAQAASSTAASLRDTTRETPSPPMLTP